MRCCCLRCDGRCCSARPFFLSQREGRTADSSAESRSSFDMVLWALAAMISLLWLLWAFCFVLVTAVPLDKRIVSVCKHFSASNSPSHPALPRQFCTPTQTVRPFAALRSHLTGSAAIWISGQPAVLVWNTSGLPSELYNATGTLVSVSFSRSRSVELIFIAGLSGARRPAQRAPRSE
jgi:hypothetical protein